MDSGQGAVAKTIAGLQSRSSAVMCRLIVNALGTCAFARSCCKPGSVRHWHRRMGGMDSPELARRFSVTEDQTGRGFQERKLNQ